MKKFNYRARDKSGVEVSGILESPSERTALKSLRDRDLLITSLSEKSSFDIQNISIGKSRVSDRDIAQFTRLLATMLSTGLPLTDALSNLSSQTNSKYFQEIIVTILRDVQDGSSFSSAIQQYPNVFSNLYINLTKAGEASGKIGEALEKLADTLEANMEFKSKIKGALTYPIIVTVLMFSIATFMITTIIPKIAEVYKQFNAELPLPTKILITMSDVIRNYSIFVILILVLIYIGYKIFRNNPVSDMMINNALLKLPIIGQMNTEAIQTIMTRTLSTLLASGVSIIDALVIISKTIDNNWIRLGLDDAAKSVEKGMPLSLAIKNNPNFPQIMSQLLAIGEETGTVDQSLERLAKFFGDNAERKVKTLTTALEPVMLVVMGIGVAGLAIAVLMPMFNLVNVIK